MNGEPRLHLCLFCGEWFMCAAPEWLPALGWEGTWLCGWSAQGDSGTEKYAIGLEAIGQPTIAN